MGHMFVITIYRYRVLADELFPLMPSVPVAIGLQRHKLTASAGCKYCSDKMKKILKIYFGKKIKSIESSE